MAVKKDKKCLDCGNLIYYKSVRCRKCANVTTGTCRKRNNDSGYRLIKPADTIQIDEIGDNTIVITAYQDASSTQMKYFKDRAIAIVARIKTEITAYTFDPLVYDSKQYVDRITINRNTIITGV